MAFVTYDEYCILKTIEAKVNAATEYITPEWNDDDWERLYHFVFSDKISRVVYNIIPDFDWYDPDTTYQEDVCAFIGAFLREMDELKIV